ncbi:RNA-binding protein rnc1 [Astathelohania contejeani]|uniref:RNA-binding protein rnc1 n=1 Tax=Astathelohania contejeani TaxID=164912 RepID=A0ABQ7I2Z2_9MICR|nr:RNA-binding protein rnc1 [Thelohania contejeani]
MKKRSIQLTESELLNNLKNSYIKSIIREGNKKKFNENPEKYKRMGLNEYLEDDEKIIHNIIISKDKIIKLNRNFILKVKDETYTHISMDTEYKDRDTVMIRIEGTHYNVNRAIGCLQEEVENLPKGMCAQGPVSFVVVPKSRMSKIIGINGFNLANIQEKTGTKIAILPEETDKTNERKLAIHGTEEQIKKAKDLLYKSQFTSNSF